MYKNIPEFDKFVEAVEAGRISQSEFDDYVIFKYRKDTVYAKDWDNVTLHSRGIIFDKRTKECIALPFKKFFNLDETDCEMSSFPNDFNYEILEKMDGSMGCIFLTRDNQLRVTTPGSLVSDQAIWATKWLRNQNSYNLIRDLFSSGVLKVLVCEIICPLSKIVLTYDFEGLVIIAAQNGEGDYYDHEKMTELSDKVSFPVCRKYTFGSVDDIREFLDSVVDFEGFVLHWPKLGYRVKMKGQDYCIKHRIISAIHPNRIDEAIFAGKKNDVEDTFKCIEKVLVEFPEEFVEPYRNAVDELISQFTDISDKINKIAEEYEMRSAKELVMFLKGSNNPFHETYFGHIMNTFNGRVLSKKLVMTLWKEIRIKHFTIEEEE